MSAGYWTVIEPYWDGISIYDGPDAFLQALHEAPLAVRHLFTAHWCQSEVCNGGFHQFFINSTGVLAPEAAAGLVAVGLPRLAACVRSAMTVLGEPYPRDREARIGALEAGAARQPDGSDAFEALNEEFWRLAESESGGWKQAADRYAAGR